MMNGPVSSSHSNNSRAQPVEIQTIARYDFIVNIEPRPEYEEEKLWLEKVEPEILDAVRNAIDEEFGNQVQFVFQDQVAVRIERLERGSIWGTVVLVLATGISLYAFIAQYRDFYDSLVLLRQHLRSVLHRVLKRWLRGRVSYYTVNVTLSRVPVFKAASRPKLERPEPPPLYSKAFFWYLFVMNLVLMAVIAALVYRAIAIAYFGAP